MHQFDIENDYIASSKLWGSQSHARLCKIIIEENKAILQQIIEERTDLLDLLTVKELMEPDPDMGLTIAFLAIYHDKVQIIKYLHQRGVDLSKFCDSIGYGNCVFYAVSYARFDIIEVIEQLGYDIVGPCDELGQTPLRRAEAMGNMKIISHLRFLTTRRERVQTLMTKDCMRYFCRMRYMKSRRKIIMMQSVIRGFLGRVRYKKQKKIMKELQRKQNDENRRQRNKVD